VNSYGDYPVVDLVAIIRPNNDDDDAEAVAISNEKKLMAIVLRRKPIYGS